MKFLRISLLVILVPLFAFAGAHKFYISVTNVDYSEKYQSVQIITRVFIDDINAVLKERYDIPSNLGADRESSLDQEYFEKYIRTKFLVEINGETVKYDFIGKKYDSDMLICYLEVPNVPLKDLKQIGVENEMLTDIYDDQQNVVHFNINGKKKSFVLVKSHTKGMLNL
jgi:hydrogenase maturation factor HypE